MYPAEHLTLPTTFYMAGGLSAGCAEQHGVCITIATAAAATAANVAQRALEQCNSAITACHGQQLQPVAQLCGQ